MVIVDFNQMLISNLFVQLGQHTNANLDVDQLRHFVLNQLRAHLNKCSEKHNVVIACDGQAGWRKQVYKYYKARRKIGRERSDMDWSTIFEAFSIIREELREYFPYRVIHVNEAEADDIIGTLVARFGTVLNSGEPITIISGDKDFKQLQKYGNVSQLDPKTKKLIVCKDAVTYLKEQIITGDSGDDVPNILSDDNVFVTDGKRQRVMSKKRKIEFLAIWPNFPEKVYDKNTNTDVLVRENFERNRTMIDLTQTPKDIQDNINRQYDNEDGKGRSKLFGYFTKMRLSNLLSDLQQF